MSRISASRPATTGDAGLFHAYRPWVRRHGVWSGNLYRGNHMACLTNRHRQTCSSPVQRAVLMVAVLACTWTLDMHPSDAAGAIHVPSATPAPAASPSVASHSSDRVPYSGTRWEYRVETLWAGSVDGLAGAVANLVLSSNDTERLKEWGDAGWELVAIQGNRVYLKRPVMAAPTPPPHSWWWPF